jgi:RNA polymerase-interacting CarD/CdnL/TRCF family regulator
MNSEQKIYGTGDWIVHVFYGLGQVIGREKKILEGENNRFLKVKTADSLYWIPVANIENDRIRPIASKNQFRYALALIRKPPKKLSENYLERRKEISKTLKNVSLYSKARMIRDLNCRRTTSKFNSTDENVLINMKELFLNEWTLVMDEDREILEQKLNTGLKTGMGKV